MDNKVESSPIELYLCPKNLQLFFLSRKQDEQENFF